jgi:hypothetical protein
MPGAEMEETMAELYLIYTSIQPFEPFELFEPDQSEPKR